MRVVGHDPQVPDGDPAWTLAHAQPRALDALLAEADVVSLHLPLVAATRGLFGRERLSRMKPGAILVNTARGGIVDEAALAALLREGRLGGAALDVFDAGAARRGLAPRGRAAPPPHASRRGRHDGVERAGERADRRTGRGGARLSGPLVVRARLSGAAVRSNAVPATT